MRRPLHGHPYHDKTDAQLHYILKDAGEAARCMRDVSPVAEAKYLDQVNDACTVLRYRREHGFSKVNTLGGRCTKVESA